MNTMEEVKNVLEITENYLKKLENKKGELLTKVEVQKANVEDAEANFNNFNSADMSKLEKYDQIAELANKVSVEAKKLEDFEADLNKNELDHIIIEKSKGSLQDYLNKYEQEYDNLLKQKESHVNALNNPQITPEMKQMQENTIDMIDLKIQNIELSLNVMLNRIINKLPEDLQKKVIDIEKPEKTETKEEAENKDIVEPAPVAEENNNETIPYERTSDDVVNIKGPSLSEEKEQKLLNHMEEKNIDKVVTGPTKIEAFVGDKVISGTKPSIPEKIEKIEKASGIRPNHIVSEPNIPRQKVKKITIIKPQTEEKIKEKSAGIISWIKNKIDSFKGETNESTIVGSPSNDKTPLTGEIIANKMTNDAPIQNNINEPVMPVQQTPPAPIENSEVVGLPIAPNPNTDNQNQVLTGESIKQQMLQGDAALASKELAELTAGVPERDNEEYQKQMKAEEENSNSFLVDNNLPRGL